MLQRKFFLLKFLIVQNSHFYSEYDSLTGLVKQTKKTELSIICILNNCSLLLTLYRTEIVPFLFYKLLIVN